MSARITTLVAFAAAVLGTATVNAETLQNDGFQTGDTINFHAGLVAGEEVAVTLSPPSANPWKLDNVQFLFGGATTTQTVTLNVYADSVGAVPGAVLFTGDYQVTGANNAMSQIDLSGDNIVVTGAFRVGIGLQHTGVPTFGADVDNNIAATKNFLKEITIGWVQSNLLGVVGDWVIRANVTEQGGPVADAGPTADASPNSPDASTNFSDASPNSPDAGPNDPDAGTVADTCSLNSDCTNGSYCGGDSLCTFDCRVDLDCTSDLACDEVGRCVEPEASDGGCGCSSGGSTPLGLLTGLFMMVLLFRRRA